MVSVRADQKPLALVPFTKTARTMKYTTMLKKITQGELWKHHWSNRKPGEHKNSGWPHTE